jgi:hypothetical protein
LFRVFFRVGIIVIIVGIFFIVIDLLVHSFTEGLRSLGTRFIIAGAISITIAYLYKYHKILGFLMSQVKNKVKKQDRFSQWGKP